MLSTEFTVFPVITDDEYFSLGNSVHEMSCDSVNGPRPSLQ